MNGFPRLRICTMYNNIGSGSGSFSNTWTGSTSLRALNLCIQMLQCEQLRSICPRLRRLTTHMFKVDDLSLGTYFLFLALSNYYIHVHQWKEL